MARRKGNRQTIRRVQQTSEILINKKSELTNAADVKKARPRIKYNVTINYTALKKLDKTVANSFLDVVRKVILIDGKPFDEYRYTNIKNERVKLKLHNGRRATFEKMIRQYAEIAYDKNKCEIVKVFDNDELDEIGNVYLQKRKDKIQHS